MFTGIVEETGSIRSLRLSGSSGKIAIRAKKVLGGTRIGDSIAVMVSARRWFPWKRMDLLRM